MKPLPIIQTFSFLAFFCGVTHAVQTFFPPSIPLSIRSPYMSVWHISTAQAGSLGASGQHFWGQSQKNQGWQGTIRIDNEMYIWLGGDDYIVANITDVIISPTRSIFVMQTGPMSLNVTFLSPIEPDDLVKQSLPFSYISLNISALDDKPHEVQLYMDISAEWVSGNKSSNQIIAQWSQKQTNKSIYLEIDLQNPQPYTEYNNQAQDGKAYCAMALGTNLTWQNGILQDTYTQFQQYGNLTDQESNPAYGTINSPGTGVAFAVDLGSIQSTSTPVTWAFGYVRDPSIQYTTNGGDIQNRRPYFVTQYTDIDSVIDAATTGFSDTSNRALALETKIMDDAANISTEYTDLVSLAAPQAISALDFTVGSDSEGKANPSDVMAFMKDIGSFRIPGRVNPVERMFAAFPMYLYLNASLCGAILRPLLEAQISLTGQPYASYDLGATYPVASGIRGDPSLGIEESGNMLIMMYAHARYSGDGSLLSQYYSLTKRWADYLVNNTLTPSNQQSADGQTMANMTNLALKGIIGVKSMAEIARATGNDGDAVQYDANASALIAAWESLAMSSSGSHILGVYGDEDSWSMLYNAYADRLLGTGLLSQSLLSNQTQFYGSLLNTASSLGLPIDSSSAFQNVSIPWTLFTAATVTDNTIRDKLIHQAWSIASNNATLAFGIGDQYSNTPSGIQVIGDAGPASGAIYSLLTLNLPNMTIIAPQVANSDPLKPCGHSGGDSCPTRKSPIAAIVGGVVGGLGVIGIAALASYLWRKRHLKYSLMRRPGSSTDPAESSRLQGYDPTMSERNNRPTLPGHHMAPNGDTYLDTTSDPSPSISPFTAAFQRRIVALHQASDYTSDASAAPSYHSTPGPLPVVGDAKRRDVPPQSLRVRSEQGMSMTSFSTGTTDVRRLREEFENLQQAVRDVSSTRRGPEPPPEYSTEYDLSP